MALRWGIASAGKISHDFVNALGTQPTKEHEVVAVAARDLEKAREFAKRHGISTSYQGYAQLAKDPKIEIVYVGTIATEHFEVVKMMMENGKNVLCEKPLCINYKQSKKLTDIAREKNLFFMEAIWSRFFPAYVAVRQLIKEGQLGKVHQVNVDFGMPLSGVERMISKAQGGGTVLDLGVYVIQFAQMVFGSEPSKITAVGHLNDNGVDSAMACSMTYADGGIASLSTNLTVRLPNEAVVIGTKGTIKMPFFWCPDKLQYPDGSWKEFPLPSGAKHEFNFDNSQGLRYEADECKRCIRKGLKESPEMTWNHSLTIAKIEDSIRSQIGVHFDADD